jgi:hypothetical protein
MAYKKGKGKMARMKKMEPAALTLTLATPSSAAGITRKSFIDLSQIASLVNRRFYRQGINWAVAGFKVSSLKAGTVTVGKLPTTWVMSNAWEKGFRSWQRMNEAAMTETESVRPRFLDFKIYANSDHHTAGFAGNLLPISFTGDTATAGEWESSKYVLPKTDGTDDVNSREILAVGASYPGPSAATTLNAVSLIEGYAASRGLPNVTDPNTPTDARDAAGTAPENWMQALFNEGTEQDDAVLTDLTSENNLAPYPFENDGVNVDTMYPGGSNQLTGLEYHDFVNIYETNVTDGIGTQRLKGGMFPCGLIALHWTPASASANLVVQIDLVPGSHRGYLCEPMTDM